MQHRTLVASAIVVALCAACADAPVGDAKSAHRDPVYRTGSNIPVRDPDAATRVITTRPDDMMPRTNMPDPRPRPIVP